MEEFNSLFISSSIPFITNQPFNTWIDQELHYHSQTLLEFDLLLEAVPPDWTSRSYIIAMKQQATLRKRHTELKKVIFCLTTQSHGFDYSDQTKIWHCHVLIRATLNYLNETGIPRLESTEAAIIIANECDLDTSVLLQVISDTLLHPLKPKTLALLALVIRALNHVIVAVAQ